MTKVRPRLAGPSPRDPQRSPASQTRHQLPPQPASALHIGRLVDGLVRGFAQTSLWGKVDPEAVRDLLRTPRLRPPPISPPAVTATRPAHLGSWHHPTVGVGDLPTQAILHIPAQLVVGHQLGDLRAARTPLWVPLRCCCPINHPTTAGRRVPPQLPRNRRRRSVLTRHTPTNRFPEPHPVLTPRLRRSTRRTTSDLSTPESLPDAPQHSPSTSLITKCCNDQLNPPSTCPVRYSNRLTDAGIEPSVGSACDSYDNALAESVIGLYKTELIRTKGPWRDLD